jgi:hypothetical protein
LIYGRRPLDHQQIREIGDGINHAIFTDEELGSGLNRLMNYGHVRRVGEKYVASPSVKRWYAKATKGKRHTYVFKDLERVYGFLGITKP